MAVITTNKTDNLDKLRLNTNDVSSRVGDTTTLSTASTNLTDAVNEHDTEIGDLSTLNTSATTIVGAINEHESDIGNIANLATGATTLVGGINEHETDLYSSTAIVFDGLSAKNFKAAIEEAVDEIGQVTSLTTTAKTNTVAAINELHTDIGDLGASGVNLNTSAANLTSAINEVHDDLGTLTNLTTTTKTNAVAAINELHSDVGDLVLTGLSATNLSAGVRELRVDIGDASTLATTATNITSAVNEHEVDLYSSTAITFDGLSAKNFKAAIEEAVDEIGQVTSLTTTAKTSVVAAVNEHDTEIGTISSLTTSSKTNLVSAINEHDAEIGALSGKNASFTATTLVGMINELDDEKVYLTSSSQQSLNSDLYLPAGKTFTVDGTLDVTSGQLNVPSAGGELNVTTTFISLGDPTSDTAANGGIIVNRGDGGTATPLEDVRIYWDETSSEWKTKSFDNDGSVVNSKIVTFFNAKDLFANNTETGVTVSWDSVNENFDVSINNNAVALGTQTTGNYVATVAAGSNMSVSGSGSETAAVTVGLVANPVVSGITAGNITVGVATDNTITTSSGNLVIDSATNIVDVNAATNLNGNTSVTGTLSTTSTATLNSAVVTNDLSVGGNLTVTGTTTYINTQQLNVGDNIFVLNADVTGSATENSGMEVERGTDSNVSVLWNETSDRWQFTDTAGTWNILRPGSDTIIQFIDGDGTIVTADSNDALRFIEGAGIDVNFTDTVEPEFGLTITNTDRGSSQNIFKNMTDGTNTASADNNNDTFTFAQGGALTVLVDAANDKVTYSHADTSTLSGTYGSSGVSSVTVDSYGHVSGITTATYDNYVSWTAMDADGTSYTVTSGDVLQFAEGNGIDSNFTADDVLTITNTKPFDNIVVQDGDGTNVTLTNQKYWKFVEGTGSGATIDINWTDTTTGSSAAPYDLTFAVTNTDKGSSQNIFKNIAVSDTNSGYTWTSTGTIVADNNNDTVTFVDGAGIDISADAASDAILIQHSDTSTASSITVNNSNGTVIQDITVTIDTYGHVTAVSTASVDLDARYDARYDSRYLKLDASNDPITGTLHITGAGDELLRLTDNSALEADQKPFISFYQGTNQRGYIQFVESTTSYLQLVNAEFGEAVKIGSGINGLVYTADGSDYTVYHSGNLPSDTDTLDIVTSRGNTTTNSITVGSLTSNGGVSGTTGTFSSTVYEGGTALNTRYLGINAKAADSNLLDGIDSSAFLRSNATDTASGVITFSNITDSTSTTTGAIIVSGGVGIVKNLYVGGTVVETSDARLKSDVLRIENALSKVEQLSGYTYIKEGSDVRQTGVIAQEVQKVLPEAVVGDENEYGVAYGNMVGLLIEAIKDLKAEIDDLKSKM